MACVAYKKTIVMSAVLLLVLSCSNDSDLSLSANNANNHGNDPNTPHASDSAVSTDSPHPNATDTDPHNHGDSNNANNNDNNGVDTSPQTSTDPPPLVFLPWDPPTFNNQELPPGMPVVNIEISAEDAQSLDANPYTAEDVLGDFTDGNGKTYTQARINYRGAYQLKNIIEHEGLRNWKVKFAANNMYLNRREWNFNYEPHFRQKLALDLLRFADVRVPSAQHVILQVNGRNQGMYLQYEDPDSKNWLFDMFGYDDGDLYKAALDMPLLEDHEKCFATFETLGTDFTSAQNGYMCHYNKKTNHKRAPYDYTTIGEFIVALNNTPESDIEGWFYENFDVESFLSYLVVSNFIANWDSYPQRPKNFWVYHNPRSQNLIFIPWDLDNTFHEASTWDRYNQMGTTASIFYELDKHDYREIHSLEGKERPLARRLIKIPAVRQAYINRYRALVASMLNPAYLGARIDELNAIVSPHISSYDRTELSSANTGMKSFVEKRHPNVIDQLNAQP